MSPQQSTGNFVSRPLDELIEQWLAHDRGQWQADGELYRKLAERFLKLSEYILAHDVAAEGLEVFPAEARWVALRVRLRQLQGLALARSGASEKANAIFAVLRGEGHADEETLGGLARTHKDLGLAATGDERAKHLRLSHEIYVGAYEAKAHNYWAGINAATTALLLGETERARDLAREVRSHCLAQCPGGQPSTNEAYWLSATIGEAALILGDVDEAEQWYRRAVTAALDDWGSIASTRRAARLIAAASGDVTLRARVENCLPIPNVVVFTGHMIDQPGRAVPRFPASLEGPVKDTLREKLAELNAGIGFASAACGSDILFLEAIRERGGECNVVLPYAEEGFIQDSVDLFPGADWRPRLAALVASRRPVIASPQLVRLESVTYDYANILLHGLAKIRADHLDTRLIPLAVWDGRQGDGPGGTADVIQRWRALGCEPEIVDLAGLLRTHHPELSTTASSAPPDATRHAAPLPRAIKAMLFADVVKFSRIPEESYPQFAEHFMGGVARLAAESPFPPMMRNTWGDAVFLVFDTVEHAGCFALDLCDLVTRTDWAALDLPAGLNVRIAVHAGPIFSFHDPVAGHPGCIGTHVNRAARLEPVTPAGQVYASQEFAAIAALGGSAFVCDYAGRVPLPKHFGTFPTYHVRRR